MGQYKLWGTFNWQIGLLISYEKNYQLSIDLPFIKLIIGLTESARGIGWN